MKQQLLNTIEELLLHVVDLRFKFIFKSFWAINYLTSVNIDRHLRSFYVTCLH